MTVSASATRLAVDTSALVSILFREDDADILRQRLRRAEKVFIGATTVLETRLVVFGRRGYEGVLVFEDMLAAPVFEFVPIGGLELDVAWKAFQLFGKGRGHPAALNFGDTLSYAVAKTRHVPLLFKGEYFGHTDLLSALDEG